MANEIIRGETSSIDKTDFHFYIPIPELDRVTIGDTATLVVDTPTSGIDPRILVVLDGPKQTALDAGEALMVIRSLAVTDNANVRSVYSRWETRAVSQYKDKYKNFGREINKE